MKLNAVRVDPRAQTEGEWYEFPSFDGFAVRARGNLYAPYRAALDHARRRAARRSPDAIVPPDMLEQITMEEIVNHLLLDWRGLLGDDGQPIEFSKDKARDLLLDPAYRPLGDLVVQAVVAIGQETEAERAAAAKNSGAPSAGS